MIMMNNNLRVFLEVAKRGSFTAAAKGLFISQPAISHAIKALEEELNVKLFFRDKRNGLVLTDVGQQILSLGQQMAEVENRIYQAAFRENNFLGGRVRIASMPIFTTVILSKVLYRFKTKYPCVTVDILEGTARNIRDYIEGHKVDFGFTMSPFGTLDRRIVLPDRMIAISRDPFQMDAPINLFQDSEKYILCYAGHESVLEKLKDQKVKLERSMIVHQSEAVVNLVAEGNGIGIISEFVLNAYQNSLFRHSIHPAVTMEIALVAIDLNDLTPVAVAFMNMILEECEAYLKAHEMQYNVNREPSEKQH